MKRKKNTKQNNGIGFHRMDIHTVHGLTSMDDIGIKKEIKDGMSTLDRNLPKYYKGYDIDILINKMTEQKQLTDQEEKIILEVQDIYYKRKHEENRKRMEEIMKQHMGELGVGQCAVNGWKGRPTNNKGNL